MKINALVRFLLFTCVFAFNAIQATKADQQISKDEAVNFGKSLLDGVQNLSKTTDPVTTPGFGGTGIPQSDYYTNQDLSGLKEEASVDLTNGAASESAQFAYEKSSVPKLMFSITDPIIQNADNAGDSAILNPEVITTTTGDCTVEDVSSEETLVEHCTAWKIPTQHTCNKTLNVDVNWENESNCPLGIGFNEVFGGFSPLHTNFTGRARAYCNPGSGDDAVDIQTSMNGLHVCNSWVQATVPTEMPNRNFVAHLKVTNNPVKCSWGGTQGPWRIIVTAQGACTADDCAYGLEYNLLGFQEYDDNEGGYVCVSNNAVVTNLSAQGFTDPLPIWYYKGSGSVGLAIGNSALCVVSKASAYLEFEKPKLELIPHVTESWADGCGYLEAQVQ